MNREPWPHPMQNYVATGSSLGAAFRCRRVRMDLGSSQGRLRRDRTAPPRSPPRAGSCLQGCCRGRCLVHFALCGAGGRGGRSRAGGLGSRSWPGPTGTPTCDTFRPLGQRNSRITRRFFYAGSTPLRYFLPLLLGRARSQPRQLYISTDPRFYSCGSYSSWLFWWLSIIRHHSILRMSTGL